MSPGAAADETSPFLHASTSLNSNDVSQERNGTTETTRSNLFLRIGAAMFSFVVLGLIQSTIGVMLPQISKHYHLSDLHVSLVFIAGPVGYVLAAQFNSALHSAFGQRGVAVLGPILHVVAVLVLGMHPSFPLILLGFALAAMGIGLLDGSWCAWAGSMANANTVSGLLHGSFSVGAAAGPFIAGSMMSKGDRMWYEWYYVLVSHSVSHKALQCFSSIVLNFVGTGYGLCPRIRNPCICI
jgi:fucose permease